MHRKQQKKYELLLAIFPDVKYNGHYYSSNHILKVKYNYFFGITSIYVPVLVVIWWFLYDMFLDLEDKCKNNRIVVPIKVINLHVYSAAFTGDCYDNVDTIVICLSNYYQYRVKISSKFWSSHFRISRKYPLPVAKEIGFTH